MAKRTFLDFEQPIAELEGKIDELRYVQSESAVDISDEIDQLSKKSLQLTKEIYSDLTPWQITKIARGNPLGFVIKTAVMPEVTLPDYKKIAAAERKEESTDVTEEEFNQAILEIRQMRAKGIKENIEKENMAKGIANPEPVEGEEKKEEAKK
mgnify:CR=1 FL=1